MKRVFDISSIIILSTADWASRTQPLSGNELGINSETNEFRIGPGLWDQCGPPAQRVVVEVAAAITTNITVATALNDGDTLDGVELADGDLVLVAGQSSASANGIYTVGESPARSAGYTTFDSLAGVVVRVKAGTANGGKVFRSNVAAGGTINSTAIPFSAISVGQLHGGARNQVAGLNAAPALNDNMLVMVEDPTTGNLVRTTLGAIKTYVTP